jgi:hypothetical protein
MDRTGLDELIAEFAASHPEWETESGARNQCCDASEAFLSFLCTKGVADECRADFYDFLLPNNENPAPYAYQLRFGDCPGHRIVKTKFCFVDFTARQYNPDLPFPYILREKS